MAGRVPVHQLHAMVTAIKTDVHRARTFAAQPYHFLLQMSGKSPALWIINGEGVELPVAHAVQMGVALGVRAREVHVAFFGSFAADLVWSLGHNSAPQAA
jgi:hypothetical protein